MAWRQKYTPNFNLPNTFVVNGVRYTWRGWCLKLVDDAGNAPARKPNARAALNVEIAAKRLRTNQIPENIWVVGFLDLRSGSSASDDHVFLMRRKGNVLEIRDSEVQSGARTAYRSIAEILAWYGAYSPIYVGWSTHCDGRQWAESYTPTPSPKPVPKPSTGDYKVGKTIKGYKTARDAKSRQNSNSTVPAGTYHTFNTAEGMKNISRVKGQPGWWINPGDNVNAPKAQYVVVKPGWGLSNVAQAAGFTDFGNAARWTAIAKLNGSSNWSAFNKALKVGQKVRVK